MKKKIVALGMTSTLLIGFCPLPIYATDIDTTTSKVLYDSEIDVENIGSGDTSSELSTTESSEFVEDSIENIESSTFEETTQEEYVGNQEQASDSSDSNEMIQEIEIPDFDEEQTYPSRRSDLTTSPTTFSTFSSLPAISATDINLPDKNFIDVASWNGEISVEEYKIIKSYGVTGVVVKLTEATSYQNPCAEKQVANALAAGLKVSVYHYSWFTDKNSAREEADYFAKMAIRLNLPKDTVMVNDIEESQIANNNNHTDNSKEFEKRLGELGFTNVNHYVGLNWINVGLIDPVSLGNTKMWVAAYPYTLNTTNRYTEYGAWQWSSRLSFPGVAGEFDISADYAQNYSKNDSENKIDLKKYDKFVTITHRNYPILKSVDGDKKDNSDNHYGKVYEAKQYADYNGIRYISLYNNKGLLVGYINEGATQIANGQNGVYQTYNQYVTIKSKTHDIYENFNWKKKDHTSNHYGEVYMARGYSMNYNGLKYYTLYDNKGNWLGYVDETAIQAANGQNGVYQTYNQYVTIKSKTHDIYENFNWKKKDHTSNHYGEVYMARGYSMNYNGLKYYTLYDNKGNWLGYVDETAIQAANGQNGVYQTYNQYVTIKSKTHDIYENFNWKKKDHTSKHYGEVYMARGYSMNYNGLKYYTLYDNKGNWLGYVDETAIQAANGQNGVYQTYNQYVTIKSKTHDIYENFNWKKKDHTSNHYGEVYMARGYSMNYNGLKYYTLYNSKGNWLGYVESAVVE